MTILLEKLVYPSAITDVLICQFSTHSTNNCDLLLILKGNDALELITVDRENTTIYRGEYSLPCPLAAGVVSLYAAGFVGKDELASYLLAATKDYSMLAFIKATGKGLGGRTETLKTIPLPQSIHGFNQTRNANDSITIAVDRFQRAFLVAMPGSIQVWLLHSTPSQHNEYQQFDPISDIVSTSEIFDTKTVVFSEFLYPHVLDPDKIAIMFCLRDNHDNFSVAAAEICYPEAGLAIKLHGPMPLPPGVERPVAFAAVSGLPNSCLLATENGLLVIRTDDIEQNDVMLKQYLMPSASRIAKHCLDSVPRDENLTSIFRNSESQLISCTENGDIILIELKQETSVEISRLLCGALDEQVPQRLRWLGNDRFLISTECAVYIFSISLQNDNHFSIQSSRIFECAGSLNDLAVCTEDKTQNFIMAGNFKKSIRKIRCGMGAFTSESISPPEFSEALEIFEAGSYIFVSMINDTYCFSLDEDGALLDVGDKFSGCNRETLCIESIFDDRCLVQVHRSGIVAHSVGQTGGFSSQIDWKTTSTVCAASIDTVSKLCLLALENGVIEIVFISEDISGGIKLESLSRQPLQTEISCVKISSVLRSTYCIVGTYIPDLQLFCLNENDRLEHQLTLNALPSPMSIPHALDLVFREDSGIIVVCGTRDGMLVLGEIHQRLCIKTGIKRLGHLPIKLTRKGNTAVAFSDKTTLINFSGIEVNFIPILLDEKIKSAIFLEYPSLMLAISSPFLKTISLSQRRTHDQLTWMGHAHLIERCYGSKAVTVVHVNGVSNIMLIDVTKNTIVTQWSQEGEITSLISDFTGNNIIYGISEPTGKHVVAISCCKSGSLIHSVTLLEKIQALCLLTPSDQVAVASGNSVLIMGTNNFQKLCILSQTQFRWHINCLSYRRDLLMVGCMKDGVSLLLLNGAEQPEFIRGDRYTRDVQDCLLIDGFGLAASGNFCYGVSLENSATISSSHRCLDEIFCLDFGEYITALKIVPDDTSKIIIATTSGAIWCLNDMSSLSAVASNAIELQANFLEKAGRNFLGTLELAGFLCRMRGGAPSRIIDYQFGPSLDWKDQSRFISANFLQLGGT